MRFIDTEIPILVISVNFLFFCRIFLFLAEYCWKYNMVNEELVMTFEIRFLTNYLDTETIQALSNFLKNTSHGSFTIVIQDNKVIGFDSLIKKRTKKTK